MGSNNRTTASDQGAAIADIPNTPTVGTVTVSGATATVPATAATTGGKFVNFLATSSPGGYTGTSTSSPITVRNLMSNTAYTFTVQVQNERFNSPASSASNSITSGVASSIALFSGPSSIGTTSVNGSDIVTACAYNYTGGYYRAIVSSFDSTTTEVYERQLAPGGTYSIFGQKSATDSSGNSYIAGQDSNSSPYGIFVAKYNSSGTIQWQRKMSSTYSCGIYSLKVDSSGNVYIFGYTQDSNNYYYSLIVKFNTSGTLQWQKQYRYTGGSGSSASFANSGFVDANYVYVTGYVDGNNGYTNGYTLKLAQSDGSLQWEARYNNANGYTYSYGSAVDSSGNNYQTGAHGNSKGYIIKLNSGGSLQWARTLSTADNSLTNFNASACDTSGNLYASASTYFADGSTNRDSAYIVKYDTNGTIQWQRRIKITGTPNNGPGTDIKAISDGLYATSTHFYLASNTGFLFKLPVDGSLTGTYTFNGYTIVYESFTATEATPSYTFSNTVGATFQTSSFQSASTTTYTDSASTVLTGAIQRF